MLSEIEVWPSILAMSHVSSQQNPIEQHDLFSLPRTTAIVPGGAFERLFFLCLLIRVNIFDYPQSTRQQGSGSRAYRSSTLGRGFSPPASSPSIDPQVGHRVLLHRGRRTLQLGRKGLGVLKTGCHQSDQGSEWNRDDANIQMVDLLGMDGILSPPVNCRKSVHSLHKSADLL
ncbi:hypothetical protein HUJ05_011382 [Dendroctonus ponderosae]|nr:hypothetical protein HUJ05_011382 [Dendroctonus ponderosae]